jgi:hypothetical protein
MPLENGVGNGQPRGTQKQSQPYSAQRAGRRGGPMATHVPQESDRTACTS